jgi:hypothetical protein
MRAQHAFWIVAALALLGGERVVAQPVDAAVGRPISAVVDDLRGAGLPFAYSTAVLPPSMTVLRVAQATDPIELVRELLQPHGLALRWTAGLYVVVRTARPSAPVVFGAVILTPVDSASGVSLRSVTVGDASAGLTVERLADGRVRLSGDSSRRYGITLSAPGFEPLRHSLQLAPGERELEVELAPWRVEQPDLVVTASRYEILSRLSTAPFRFDRRAIEQRPDLGDDPLRAVHRLPGTAAGGTSAKAHVRGGEDEETAIVLNGQRLLDPFHIRDYQSLFSAIDARAIDGIEVYTGGFPVRYGDRIGGLVLLDAAASSDQPRHTELGLSVFNTSVLSAGTIGDGTGNWLVSARRSNLDRVINEDLGEPTYHDFFGKIGVNFSPRNTVTVNILSADDRVLVVTESDPSEREESSNVTRNTHLWVHWQQEWSSSLASSTAFFTNRFDSRRIALVDDPEKIVGSVDDRRDVALDGMRQHWTAAVGEHHLLSWGGEYQRLAAEYDYASSADYFGFFTTFSGVPTAIRRNASVAPDGDLVAIYFSDRWEIGSWATDLGWRWDEQSYTSTPNERQFSPRFNVLRDLGERTELRFGIGRYFQSQGIHELQVEDGVTEFFPAQRSDQAVIGLSHRFGDRYSARFETYWKSLRQLRPRFENAFDPLAVIPELEPDRVRIAPERAFARGLEVSLAYDGPGELQWWASYVLSKVEDRIAGRDVPRSWDQRHATQFGLTRDTARWDFVAALNVHSGWPTTGLTFDQTNPTAPAAILGERNALRLGGFASLDVRASRTLPLRVGSLDVFFEISNATGRANPCCVDFDLEEDPAGRLFLEQSTDHWLPRLMSLGVLWKF